MQKFLLAFGIIMATALFFGGLLTYKEIKNLTRENSRREITGWAIAAANLVDTGEHEKIFSPADENSILYQRVREPLRKIIKDIDGLGSVYTLRKTGEKNIAKFVVDTVDSVDENGNGIIDPAEDRAHVGEEYDFSEYPGIEEAFSGKASSDQDISCDKWGCWLSGYAPLKDQGGNLVGIVGVDMDAGGVVTRENRAVGLLFIILLLMLGFSLIILALVLKFFSQPLSILKEDIGKFSADNLDYRINNLETGDEFEMVAGKFNAMAGEIAKSHRNLEKKVAERTHDLSEANKELGKNNIKLKEMDEIRKNFVSYTAHELKNPLNVFRWSLEMLRSEDLGKINLKQREIVEQLYTSNDRLLSLVNDLLDVSRLDEARLKVQPASCQIEEIIDEAAGNLAVRIKSRDINFVWNKPSPAMPKVLADKDRVLQVILNLLSNAVKFTPSGKKIEITVSAANRVAPEEVIPRYGFIGRGGKYIQVRVADEGLGIPKDEQGKIFSRFFRGSNVKRANIEGTGLGMFITFEIIKIHGGAIWFESEENKGTAFYFTLPVA